MRLADLRRAAIKTHVRIRFPIADGLECVVSEHGVAQVPSLKAIPNFNLEEELAKAPRFTLEPAGPADKTKAKPQILDRKQLAALVVPRTAEATHDEHEE